MVGNIERRDSELRYLRRVLSEVRLRQTRRLLASQASLHVCRAGALAASVVCADLPPRSGMLSCDLSQDITEGDPADRRQRLIADKPHLAPLLVRPSYFKAASLSAGHLIGTRSMRPTVRARATHCDRRRSTATW